MALNNFPMDVMYTILTRLPVKSLIRFKCVCKAWRDLISSPDFIKSHLHRSLESNSNPLFVFTRPYDSLLYQIKDPATFFPIPIFELPGKENSIIGSCNGLICVDCNSFLVLCNPSTGTLCKPVHYPEEVVDRGSFGFGYDLLGDDYKIVVWSSLTRGLFVYSLKDNSWTKLLLTSNFLSIRKYGVFGNNCLYWTRRPGEVIAFDLHHETLSIIPLPKPNNIKDDLYSLTRLAFFNGCLCLRTDNMMRNRRPHTTIWMMKEYSMKGSWTTWSRFDYEDGGLPLAYCDKEKSEIIFEWNRLRLKSFFRGKKGPGETDIRLKRFFRGKKGPGETDNIEFTSTLHKDMSGLTFCVESLTRAAPYGGFEMLLPRSKRQISLKEEQSWRKFSLMSQGRPGKILRI